MKSSILCLYTAILLLLPLPAFAADDTIDKTICKLAVGYQDVDEIQADLLAAAKREVINELFGEMIVASTAVENFVVTSDQIRTSSIGFVRVDGNADFFNGKGFAEVCVTIHAYVTDEDKAQFIPERLEKKYCDADDDMTTAQLIAYVKDEAVIQRLIEYNPDLKGADRDSLLQLVQKVSYPESGFIPDTQTYCATFEGEVVPVEITAFLETDHALAETTKSLSNDGLMAHFPFTGNANDATDSGNNGVVHGATLVKDRFGRPDNAYYFDGKNDYIEIPAHSKLDTRSSISIFAWINPQGDAGPIINYCTNCWGVHLWQSTPSNLFVRFMTRDLAMTDFLELPVLTGNSWNLVGATYDHDSGIATLWHDGKSVNSINIGRIELATQFPIRIGVRDSDNRLYKGVIDDVRIYNRALTEEEVQALYLEEQQNEPNATE